MHNHVFKALLFLAFLAILPASLYAQDSTQDQTITSIDNTDINNTDPVMNEPALTERDEEIIEEDPAMIPRPVVKLRSLDKITARAETFEASVGATVKFGSLYIKPRTCQEASPLEKPESASFLQIWEMSTEDEPEWVFSGWMYASSPGLSSMDHPIYDVWVLGCLEKETTKTTEAASE